MVKYEQAPYQQGYDQAAAGEKYKNPYKGDEETADADDFKRGYDNAKDQGS